MTKRAPTVTGRQELIRSLLLEHGSVKSSELVERFDVSLMTVHRDLEVMAADGWLRRTRGGATVERSALFELHVRARMNENTAAKQAIASAALTLVSRGDALFLDDSTTALALAERLGSVGPMTVITNFRKIAERAIAEPELDLIALGGRYFAPNDSYSGEMTVLGIESLGADFAFVSSSAVHDGACFHQLPQSISVKRAMLAAAGRKVLLIDRSKFASRALHKFVALSVFDTVIVDDGISERDQSMLNDVGVEVIVARPLLSARGDASAGAVITDRGRED